MSPAALLEEPKTAASSKTTLMLPLAKLQNALSVVSLAIARKTSIPVLASVKVASCAGHIDFSGTDLDLSARYRALLPEAKDGTPFLLPGLKLESFAKLLDGNTVSVTCHNDRRATLKCGRSTTRLPLQSTASFPNLEFPGSYAGISVEQKVLARVLDFTAFAISKEESRLSGALLEIEDGKLSLVATDGHRLARYTVPTTYADQFSMLLPLGLVRSIDKAMSGSGKPVMLAGDDVSVYATLDGDGFEVALAHRKMTGQFPNYKAVIPPSTPITLTVDAETIQHTLRRCSTFTDERSGAVVLTVNPDHIVLRGANADTGETDETLDVQASCEFDRFSIGFNVDYLMDAFSRLKGDVQIRFVASEPGHAVTISAEPEEGETFTYVVMPMRV